MPGTPANEILIQVRPAPARRALACGMIGVLGALLLWIVAASPPAALGWRLFLLGFGVLALWQALRLWKSTGRSLILTDEILADSAGHVLARLDRIERVERGMLAFKPSNGFLLTLSEPQPRHWSPGLWWRFGRRVGVGGVTGAGETRAMADLIALRLTRYDAESNGRPGA